MSKRVAPATSNAQTVGQRHSRPRDLLPVPEVDRVSPALRRVESEVDAAYKKNPLLSLPRAQALWHVLAEFEEIPLRLAWQSSRNGISQDSLAVADYLANLAKWPVIWAWRSCAASDTFSPVYDEPLYGAAHELGELGHRYLDYQTVFTYASKGVLDLDLCDRRIRPRGTIRSDTRLDAYDRVVNSREKTAPDASFVPWLDDCLRDRVHVDGDRFRYTVDSVLVNRVLSRSRYVLSSRVRLPQQWQLPDITLEEYMKVLRVLWCMCCVHMRARWAAVNMQCVGLGYLDGVLTVQKQRLHSRVAQLSGLPLDVVTRAIARLTLGNCDQRWPDILLQPIVPLTSDCYGMAPSLVANSNLERNLVILLNRMEDAKSAYSALSVQREDMHRDRIRNRLTGTGLRFGSGRVPGWGSASDLDLALVDPCSRCCLLLELKSFAEPADPREVYEKSREIEKGIRQIQERRQRATTHRDSLDEFLGIAADYSVYAAVVSESSVACGLSRASDVPLVRTADLIERIRSGSSLRSVCDAFARGEHLPQEGVDYAEKAIDVEVEGWTLAWYANRLL